MRLFAFCGVLALAVACGGKAKPAEEREPSALERRYASARLVPSGAAYAVVAARTGDLVDGARKLVSMTMLPLGAGPERVDAELRQTFGASLLAAEDLGKAGIALDRAAAFYGSPFPTFVFPVADSDALAGFLAERRPQEGLSAVQHRGHEVYTWRHPSKDGLEISWVVLEGWLLLHLGAEGEGRGLGWLDGALAAAEGERSLVEGEELARAVRAAASGLGLEEGEGGEGHGDLPGAVGVVRLGRLGKSLIDLAREAGAPGEALAEVSGCLDVLTAITGRVYLGGDVSWDGGDAMIAVELAPAAAAALREHLATPAPAGYYAFRDASAGFSLDWTLELAWLEALRREAACPLLSQPIVDPLAAQLGGAATSYHLAGSELDVSALEGKLAGYLTLTDPRIISRQLDRIPGRSWIERKKTVGGVDVRVVGGLPGVPEFAYRLTDRDFTVAVGGGVTKTLFSGGEAPASARGEILRIALRPARLPGLGELLGLALNRVLPWRVEGEVAEHFAAMLRRYQRLELRLFLDGDSVALRGAMRLSR